MSPANLSSRLTTKIIYCSLVGLNLQELGNVINYLKLRELGTVTDCLKARQQTLN